MKKILCVLLVIGLCLCVGCKKVAKNIARDVVVDKAIDTLADNANNSSTSGTKASSDISSSHNSSKSVKGKTGAVAAVTGGAIAVVANEAEGRSNTQNSEQQNVKQEEPDWHWIKDNNTGVYLWNPEPEDGEYIVWNGDYVQEGKYRYANGPGTVTWYKNGKVIQVDDGAFERGRHHGKFTHKFPSGKVKYSNWDHGKEI